MTLVLENSDKKKIICFYLTVQKLELHNNLMNVKLKYITSKTLNFFSVRIISSKSFTHNKVSSLPIKTVNKLLSQWKVIKVKSKCSNLNEKKKQWKTQRNLRY